MPEPIKDLSSELQELEKKFAADKRALEHKHYLRSILPNGLTPSFIHTFGYRASQGFQFKVETLAHVQEIFESIPGVPLVDLKDGFRTIIPDDAVTEKERKAKEEGRATIRLGLSPFRLSIDGGKGWGDNVKVEWWTDLQGLRVAIAVEVSNSGLYLHRKAIAYNDTFVRYEGESNLIGGTPQFKDDKGKFKVTPWFEVKYSPGSDQAKHHIVVCWDGGSVLNPGQVFGDYRTEQNKEPQTETK